MKTLGLTTCSKNNTSTFLQDYYHIARNFKQLEVLFLVYVVSDGEINLGVEPLPPHNFREPLKALDLTLLFYKDRFTWNHEQLALGPDFSLLTWSSEKWQTAPRYVCSYFGQWQQQSDSPQSKTSDRLKNQLQLCNRNKMLRLPYL